MASPQGLGESLIAMHALVTPPALALCLAHACFAALALATRSSLAAQAVLLAAGAAVVGQGRAINSWLGGGNAPTSSLSFPQSSWDGGGAAYAARVAGPVLCVMGAQVGLALTECWCLAVAVKRAQLVGARPRRKAA